jgi:hypothetical protein
MPSQGPLPQRDVRHANQKKAVAGKLAIAHKTNQYSFDVALSLATPGTPIAATIMIHNTPTMNVANCRLIRRRCPRLSARCSEATCGASYGLSCADFITRCYGSTTAITNGPTNASATNINATASTRLSGHANCSAPGNPFVAGNSSLSLRSTCGASYGFSSIAFRPEGTRENSPAIHRWDNQPNSLPSPEGTAEFNSYVRKPLGQVPKTNPKPRTGDISSFGETRVI